MASRRPFRFSLSTVNCQLSIVHCLFAVNCQLSIVHCPLPLRCQLSTVNCQLPLAAGFFVPHHSAGFYEVRRLVECSAVLWGQALGVHLGGVDRFPGRPGDRLSGASLKAQDGTAAAQLAVRVASAAAGRAFGFVWRFCRRRLFAYRRLPGSGFRVPGSGFRVPLPVFPVPGSAFSFYAVAPAGFADASPAELDGEAEFPRSPCVRPPRQAA